MTEKVTVEREIWWMNMVTGELYETHADAVAAYNDGYPIQVMYLFRFEDGYCSPWNYGCVWEV